MIGITAQLVRGYASCCVHCWHTYAVQQADGSYRPSLSPLSLSRLADHLQGRYTLGTYVLDSSGCCGFAVFDADSADGLDRLVALAGELAAAGIASVMEASRRGGHLWVFFERPVPGRLVRCWLLPYAQAYGLELYPKQDALPPGGLGSLVRLPLGVHRQVGGWFPFLAIGPDGVLVPVGETVAECCAWLCANAVRVPVPALLEDEDEEERAASQGQGANHVIAQWCRSQDIVAVIGSYTRLDQRGVGRCPLPGHHYRGDVRPSLQVFGGSDPHWYCYTWGRAGDLLDFLCLYHGLTKQEMWQRVRSGDV